MECSGDFWTESTESTENGKPRMNANEREGGQAGYLQFVGIRGWTKSMGMRLTREREGGVFQAERPAACPLAQAHWKL